MQIGSALQRFSKLGPARTGLAGIGVAILCPCLIAAAQPAPATTTSTAFDGTYVGSATTVVDRPNVCEAAGPVSVVVKDGAFEHPYWWAAVPGHVGPAGRIWGRIGVGGKAGARTVVRLTGNIADGRFEADYRVSSIFGTTCLYHWSLRRT
jgi:hypothetical protein